MKLLYIDLFCGAGGTSTGVETARIRENQFAKVIACVNHDKNAIASHASNHPEALHFTEDIRALDLTRLIAHVEAMRILYPGARVVLWASLECTNFSIAKGGQSRDADSRTLAEHLYRYVEAINPEYIQIENVKEFMTWGPLIVKVVKDKKTGAEYCPLDIKTVGKGKNKVKKHSPVWVPDPLRKGEYYRDWVSHIKTYGYRFDHRLLNSADFGALTSRRRFFGIFAQGNLPITFPAPTHTKRPQNNLFDQLKPWNPVREVLDLDDEGTSIFDRKIPVVDATYERVYAGLVKFVAGGKDTFMIKYNSVNGQTGKHIPPSIDEPCPVVAAQARLGVAKVNFMVKYNSMKNGNYRAPSMEEPAPTLPCRNTLYIASTKFLSKYFGGHPASKNLSIDSPAHSVTARDHHSVVSARFLTKYFSGNPDHMTMGIDQPAHTVRTKDCMSIVSPEFLTAYYGNGFNGSVDHPSPTVTTKDRLSVVKPCFMDQQYGNGKPASIEKPCAALTAVPKYNVVTCTPWVMNTHFNNVGSSVEAPCPTITANRKWHYLMNSQFTSKGHIDKTPSFIKFENGAIVYKIYETDSPVIVRIKEFMALYGIIDVKMRMLKIPELKQIMGFPKTYVLVGTQAEQKKYIGNAVEVTMARVLCESLGVALGVYDNKIAA